MLSPEVTYQYRLSRDTASNTIEVCNKRVEGDSADPIVVHTINLYTVPLDRIFIINSISFRVLSANVVPGGALQTIHPRVQAIPPNGQVAGNPIICEDLVELNGASNPNFNRAYTRFTGEFWCTGGATLSFRASCSVPDLMTFSCSANGLLIPRANVSSA